MQMVFAFASPALGSPTAWTEASPLARTEPLANTVTTETAVSQFLTMKGA
jgi:hypothetical protein